MAATNGYHDIVKVFLDHKASVSIQDHHGNTPLHLAASHGNYEVVKLLVGVFADVDAVTKVLWRICYYLIQETYKHQEFVVEFNTPFALPFNNFEPT